jgi:outer membrane protein OmpA-like peptidoglycan-associated protein
VTPTLQQRPEPGVQRAPTEAPPEPSSSPAGLPRFLQDAGPETAPGDGGVTDAGPAPADAGGGLPAGVPAPPLPAGPDACGTVEEEERKTQFRARSASALNFRPSAGYGQFDAYYWPASSLMAVIVKMKFNFVEADNTPPVATLWRMLFRGEDISQFFWTDAQKDQFSEEYRKRVAARWSFAHTFRSKKPCWPFAATPYVAPRVVGAAADAHFDVTVHKGSGGSKFRAENPGTPGWRGTGELYEEDNTESANFNSTLVARSERQRLERAVAAAAASPILFQKDSAVIQPADLARLHTLADAMKAKNPSDPAIPITISGFASSEGPVARNDKLSEDRANAVANELLGAGVPQPMVIVKGGPIGAPDDAANRKVDITPSTTFEGTYASNRFSAGEHEFGHAIGLPDEYKNITTGKLGAKQTAFVNLAAAAGVAAPAQWGDMTSSLMSAGVDVLPRHYLTFWEALGQMTSPDITRNEWSIG